MLAEKSSPLLQEDRVTVSGPWVNVLLHHHSISMTDKHTLAVHSFMITLGHLRVKRFSAGNERQFDGCLKILLPCISRAGYIGSPVTEVALKT